MLVAGGSDLSVVSNGLISLLYLAFSSCKVDGVSQDNNNNNNNRYINLHQPLTSQPPDCCWCEIIDNIFPAAGGGQWKEDENPLSGLVLTGLIQWEGDKLWLWWSHHHLICYYGWLETPWEHGNISAHTSLTMGWDKKIHESNVLLEKFSRSNCSSNLLLTKF